MCGIAGIISTSPVEANVIESMTKALLHRGPDARGIYLHGNYALGHTRLSIIDLSEQANQPFQSHDDRFIVIFNGEIYNFQTLKADLQSGGVNFSTHSDTEVILQAYIAWGADMIKRLEGMFAFAILDRQMRRLFLCRDRMGKKPLFYYQSAAAFVFASEIKSLLKHPMVKADRKINGQGLSLYLHLGYIPEPDTIFSSIHKFPAAHFGFVGADLSLQLTRYWEAWKDPDQRLKTDKKIVTQQLHTLLTESVKKRLVSDVPVGSFLSGGTDSSVVTAIASQYIGKFKTFSIGFSESKFDESHFALEVARNLKTDHTEYTLKEHDALQLLDEYIRHFDEPFADTSAIPTMLISKLARKEVKVVLTGDGGDELFQGYGAYTWADRMSRPFWRFAKPVLRSLFKASGKSRLQRIAKILEPFEGGVRSHIFSQEQYLFSQAEIHQELLSQASEFHPFIYQDPVHAEVMSPGERQALFDLRYYLKDDLLVKVDRASMYHGLECRCPFLDHNLVEWCLALPKVYKKKGAMSKQLLKKLLEQYLPSNLIYRPKWGFSVPLAQWLRTDLKFLVERFLSETALQETRFFNPQYVTGLVSEFQSGKEFLYNRLWVVLVLQKWWKENVTEL